MGVPEGHWVDELTPQHREAFIREELLDVVVDGVGASGWQAFLDRVTEHYPCSLVVGGAEAAVPGTAIGLLRLARAEPTALRIRIGNLYVNEYFLNEDRIELDMSPSELGGPRDIEGFLSFVKDVGDAVTREVVVRVESSRDDRGVVFRYSPGDPGPRYCVLPPS